MDNTIVHRFQRLGVIPVVVIENARDAVPLGRALADGGLPCAEITFRTEDAAEAIRRLCEELPDLLVGAGTVLSPAQAEKAIRSGARFVVSPGFSPGVVDYCLERDVPVFPGVCTPTEIEMALGKGLEVVKFFPAEAAGGLRFLKAVGTAYRMVRYIPTGGIHPGNLDDYLTFDPVLACGGTWLARSEWIRDGEWKRITKASREACRIVGTFRREKG